jgi:DNA polymerase-3 subunit gamma/tau
LRESPQAVETVSIVSYLVLARKFRPQSFEEIIGQQHVTRTLQNALTQDRVHHAFLFCGARGTGKTTTARVLAKALNCAQGPTAHPCNECSSCVQIAHGTSTDVLEIDGASHTGVDDIRELRENVRYLPTKGRRKVYIIDEVHMLSVSAFNALLKTLEEPPPHVTFMFATTEPHKIPATILSRCQRFDLRRVEIAGLTDFLLSIVDQEQLSAAPEGINLIAAESGGSVRDALSLLDQVIAYAGDTTIDRELVARVLGVTDRNTLTRLSAALLQGDADCALAVVDEVFGAGWDLVQFAKSVVSHLRDLALLATLKKADAFVQLSDAEITELKRQLEKVPPDRILQLFDSAVRATDEVARSEFPKMTLEMNLLEMALAEPLVPVGEIAARLERLENRVLQHSPPPQRGGAPSARGGSSRTNTPSTPAPHSRGRSGQGACASADHDVESTANTPPPSMEPAARMPAPPVSATAPAVPHEKALVRWDSIVALIQQREPVLAAALAKAHLERLGENEAAITVSIAWTEDAFGTQRWHEGGQQRLEKAVEQAWGKTLQVNLRKQTAGQNAPALEAGVDTTIDTAQTATASPGGAPENRPARRVRSESAPPRSLREQKQRKRAQQRARLKDDARNHPAVREIEQVLGGRLRNIRILN